jgi:Ras-related GTP-binding protein A/B
MSQHSPRAKIFVLIHKMDLIPENQREAVNILIILVFFFCVTVKYTFFENYFKKIFNRRVEELETYSKPLSFRCFQTSIWDETLYKVK